MERFLTASEARQKLLRLLDDVREGEQVVITRRGKPAAVVIDFERHRLLSELAHLWQDPQSLSHIWVAHEEVRTGRVVRVKGVPTVKRLVHLARSKGVLKARSG